MKTYRANNEAVWIDVQEKSSEDIADLILEAVESPIILKELQEETLILKQQSLENQHKARSYLTENTLILKGHSHLSNIEKIVAKINKTHSLGKCSIIPLLLDQK